MNYTYEHDSARHVRSLPDLDPLKRQYRLLEGRVALVGTSLPDGSTVEVWRIQAQNLCDTRSESLDLLQFPVLDNKPSVPPSFKGYQYSLIDETVCSQEYMEKVIELGQIKVEIINEIPGRT